MQEDVAAAKRPYPVPKGTGKLDVAAGAYVFEELNPKSVAAAAEIIATFARIDAAWTFTLAALTHTEPRMVAAMLDAILNPRTKIDVIRKAAENSRDWTPEGIGYINQALNYWQWANKWVRKPYAHDVWCYIPTHPNAIVLVPTRDDTRAKIAHRTTRRKARENINSLDAQVVIDHGLIHDEDVLRDNLGIALSLNVVVSYLPSLSPYLRNEKLERERGLEVIRDTLRSLALQLGQTEESPPPPQSPGATPPPQS